MLMLMLLWEWVGEVGEKALVDQRYEGVDGVVGEERERGEEEGVGEALDSAGLVREVRGY
jgi:hypothetical protein